MSKQQPKTDGIALRRKRELRQHEQTIELAQRSFIDLGRALGKIRAEALYIVAGYKTFESYLETRWEISPQHAYRLINAARTALILSPMGYKITSERAARELAPVADDQETLIAVYEEAQRRASDGRVTSALIAEVRAELAPDAREVVDSYVIEAQVAEATAAFDEKYSGNVGTPPSDVPGQAAADTDTASADGSPVPEPVGKAGGEPAGQGLTVEVLPGKPQDSPADSVRDEVALVASQSGSFQDLTDGQTPPPSMGSVLSPAAVPGVAPVGDPEVGEESRPATKDSFPTDPASEWMDGWRGLVAAAFSLRSEFTEEEMGEIRDDIVTLGRIFRHA